MVLSQGIILKYINEDFRVQEVPLVTAEVSQRPENTQHTLVTVSKSGYTTFEAMARLGQFFEAPKGAIHCQGLKDEDGITEQLMSVQKILSADELETFNAAHQRLDKGWIKLELRGYTTEPLQEKQLHGNVFNVRLRNMSEKQADTLAEFCQTHEDFFYANYYDQQRFGLPGGPFVAHKIGQAVVAGQWEKAEKLYRQSGNAELDFPGANPTRQDVLIKKIDPRKLNFFVSAFASHGWNQALSGHIKSAALLDIFPGHEVYLPEELTAKVPLAVSLAGYKIDQGGQVVARQKTRASFLSTTVYPGKKQADESHDGKYSLSLHFFLPAGSYATMLTQQLLIRAID